MTKCLRQSNCHLRVASCCQQGQVSKCPSVCGGLRQTSLDGTRPPHTEGHLDTDVTVISLSESFRQKGQVSKSPNVLPHAEAWMELWALLPFPYAFCDSCFADDPATMCSTGGRCAKLAPKQREARVKSSAAGPPSPALSSAEAEAECAYCADAAKQSAWAKQLLDTVNLEFF